MSEVLEYVNNLRRFQVLNGIKRRRRYAYESVEELLLEHGQEWTPARNQDDGLPLVKTWPKQCFDNAYRMARASRGRLQYAEGYAVSIIPVEHAWLINEAGEVIDPTWHRHGNGIGREYFGVTIPLERVKEIRSLGRVATALFCWEYAHPLLRERWDGGESD